MGKFLLVDWGWKRLMALDDNAEIAAYLVERERHFASWSAGDSE